MVPASTLRRKLATISGTATRTKPTTPTMSIPPDRKLSI
jgi:hypothetical protein